MISNTKTCSVAGCNGQVWSKGLCKTHRVYEYHKKERGKLKKGSKPTKDPVKLEEEVELYKSIWKSREHKSEVSGNRLGRFNLMYFHHILPKSRYPQARLDPENIILLHPDEHATVEGDMYRYEEINRRREQLKTKYELL